MLVPPTTTTTTTTMKDLLIINSINNSSVTVTSNMKHTIGDVDGCRSGWERTEGVSHMVADNRAYTGVHGDSDSYRGWSCWWGSDRGGRVKDPWRGRRRAGSGNHLVRSGS